MNLLGYDVENYISSDNQQDKISKNEAIWVGRNIPFEYVAEILEIAIDYFPHLKYVEISDDEDGIAPKYIHNQIFIGGASSTAEERKLEKLSKKEIVAIKEIKTQEEMNEYFRDKKI